MICPHCGHKVRVHPLPEALLSAPFTGIRKTMLRKMVSAYPRRVTINALVDYVYSGVGDLPEDPEQCLQVHISGLRNLLYKYGWTVSKNEPGSREPSYVLERR